MPRLKLSKRFIDDYNVFMMKFLLNHKDGKPAELNTWILPSEKLPSNTDEFILVKIDCASGFSVLQSCNALIHIVMDIQFYKRQSSIVKWMRFEQ